VSKKGEERAKRLAEKLEKFEASRAATLAKVVPDHLPKAAADPTPPQEPKLAPHIVRKLEAEAREPKAVFDGARFDEKVTWCITKADREGAWSWHEARDWDDAEWSQIIGPKFAEFEEMTWAQVDSFSSGSEHKMHHGQPFGRIVDEAQDRWRERGLEEFADAIFRFRLGGTRRAWGYILQAHFHMVWWERHHKIHRKKG
jgi:hypothetical protein